MGNLALHVGDDPVAVAANRSSLARDMGLSAVVFGRAAHSNQVAYVDGPAADTAGVDALITDRPDLGLAAQGADCVMIAIATADGWVAAVHCGWKGLVTGVVPAALNAMTDAGADLRGARAHLGPSICATCYEVDEQRAADVQAVVPEAVVAAGPAFALDLARGVRWQLHEHAVASTYDRRCTAQDPALYSYRRDHITGRQAIVIARRSS